MDPSEGVKEATEAPQPSEVEAKVKMEVRDVAIHSKSEKVCGVCFSVTKNLRKKCVNLDIKISRQKCVNH